MLIPIYDDNSKVRNVAFVTIALILLNIFIFFFLEDDNMVLGYGLIPYEVITGTDLVSSIPIENTKDSIPQAVGPTPIYMTMLTSMFLHGDVWHLLGNMLFLWIFGDNIEAYFGWRKFTIFYVLCGLGAAVMQIFSDIGSVSPMIGASGAISGVMGAYLVLFPRNKIRMLFFYFIRFNVPAWLMLIFWFGMQAMSSFAAAQEGDNVAYWAHIGGFVVGVVLAFMWKKSDAEELAFSS